MTVKGKRILVTGGSGFVGRYLVEKLKEYNVELVTLTDNLGNRIDVRDWEKIKEIGDLDMVYHLAAKTYVPLSFENPRETYEVNVLGTLNILELCRFCNVEKFIFASSYIYGQPQYIPIDEEHPLHPTNPYARSKMLGEELCRAYNVDFGVKCIIIRPFNVYGPRQNKNFLIPSIMAQLSTGKIVLKDPEPKRDFIYVSDVIDAYIKAGESNVGFEIFNIGYGKSYSVKEIVDIILRLHGNTVEVNYTNDRRKNEIMDTLADNRKAKKLLKWKPKIGIESGIKECLM